MRSCVTRSNVLISLVRRAPAPSRRHAISNSTHSTCVITCSERLRPVQQRLSSPDQSNNRHFGLLEAAHCHLKAFKRTKQIPGRSQGPELCEHVWTVWWTDWSAGGLKRSVSGAEAQLSIVWICPPPTPPLRLTWEDLTGYNCPRRWVSPQTQAQGALRPHLIVIYGQLLWFSECSRKTESQNFKNIQLWRSNLRDHSQQWWANFVICPQTPRGLRRRDACVGSFRVE